MVNEKCTQYSERTKIFAKIVANQLQIFLSFMKIQNLFFKLNVTQRQVIKRHGYKVQYWPEVFCFLLKQNKLTKDSSVSTKTLLQVKHPKQKFKKVNGNCKKKNCYVNSERSGESEMAQLQDTIYKKRVKRIKCWQYFERMKISNKNSKPQSTHFKTAKKLLAKKGMSSNRLCKKKPNAASFNSWNCKRILCSW
jgi:hypothetical protein